MVHGTHNAVADERNDNILVYVNGDLVPRNEASISVFDSGYLIGDGIWEALRLHEGVLVFLDEHLDRLWQAAAAVAMDLRMSREDLTAELWRTLEANKMRDNVHVRFMLTRGIKKTPSQDPRLVVSGPNLVIIAEHKLASPESKE
ncbi:MAG: aminotransferase class IV, partial [Proteobacteria bacterium]|nr:aminotransferase class IV [Pseudomonadota bacterium]